MATIITVALSYCNYKLYGGPVSLFIWFREKILSGGKAEATKNG